ncbi:hypothetical protein EV187_2571 [Agromyces ramosus]|uniref:Very-short-patch-repair endonuclease n=1 Tax=Agromyces ramosus TaxID=33879 RepID=A0A4Q7M972_9MICO|nr:hypothetical protein [Agromyces ramosus]RZS64191.1 hypothetical protein EV187_2571 [Agromyces ramosus]
MPRPRPLPDGLAASPFRVAEALELGATPRRLRARDLDAPFHGVRTVTPANDLLSLCRAYAVRMPQGHYFSHVTAARLWGLPLPSALRGDRRLHVSTAGREPRARGVVGHRIAEGAEIRFVEELPVLAPCDAWCQLGAVLLQGDDLVIAGDRLLGWPDPLASPDELGAAISRFAGRRGARAVARARRDIRARSGSPRETVVRLIVARAGFPEPEPNGPVELSGGRRTHGDLVFRAHRLLLEYDGEQHRLDARRFRRDIDRINDLQDAGWVVIRVHAGTPHAEIIARLDAGLRARGWEGAPRAPWVS